MVYISCLIHNQHQEFLSQPRPDLFMLISVLHVCVVDTVIRAGKHQYAGPFKSSTPETRAPESVTFDPERISAWLGQTHQLCSKAVQTEHDPQVYFA